MYAQNEDDGLPPPNTNSLAIPPEPDLLVEYELYKTSRATSCLESERNRGIFSDAFIEDPRLGTLSDLCVRALAKQGTRRIAPVVQQNPLKLRIHYDSLDVNMPLKDCYFLEDLSFWRRVVLAKSKDLVLSFRKLNEFDWRGMGISLKYVELVEACPAEYWPAKQMTDLAKLVKEYVRSMHIKHLQSLTDNSFSYGESNSELDITSEASADEDISSDERDTEDEKSSELEEESLESEASIPIKIRRKSNVKIDSKDKIIYHTDSSHSGSVKRISEVPTSLKSESGTQLKRRDARYDRNAARQELRDLRNEHRLEHERRKERREMLRKIPEPTEPPKKRRRQKIRGVFDMVVEPEPANYDDKIVDGRNKQKLLKKLEYDYPANHCHHIDLSFLGHFDMLTCLTIEFLGPKMNGNYHNRHLNFSYRDVRHLAKGLGSLNQLKIFRLRNSRMDRLKLIMLVRVLRLLDSLEVVDFGHDQLDDNCNVALGMLLDRKTMLSSLELEYNQLGSACLASIGYALRVHPGSSPLKYLGLAGNLNESWLKPLFKEILGTNHIAELSINAVQMEASTLVRDVSFLLRNHAPLRRLDMAANCVGPTQGHSLICALYTNQQISHFDCRDCDLSFQQEYEADVIIRRNIFEAQNPLIKDLSINKTQLQEYYSNRRHPLTIKLQQDIEKREECLRNIPSSQSSTELSVKEEQQEEQPEVEFDIWQELGIKTRESVLVQMQEMHTLSRTTSSDSLPPFNYNPNAFDLDEFREHLYMPGPSDRYSYFQRQINPNFRDKR